MKYRRSIAICGSILIAMTILFALYGSDKQGMFLDEICSYLFANSKYEPAIFTEAFNPENIVISQEEIQNMLEVQPNERFDINSVYHIQAQDVHPPLYYLAINFVSSVVINSHSKWIGLGVNYFFFILLICLLFLLTYRMFGTNRAAAIVTSLYALGLAGISTLLYIRMYSMLTFFTLLLANEILGQMQGHCKWYNYLAISFTICCGLLTHYYFSIYAFFAGLSLFIYLMRNHSFRQAFCFVISSILGIFVMVLIFPPFISQLTANQLVSGTTAISQLINIKMWFPRIGYFILRAGYYLLFAFVLAAVYLVLILKNRTLLSLSLEASSILKVIILPAFITFALVSIISPYKDVRYIYNIIPIALLIVPFLNETLIATNGNRINRIILCATCVCILCNIGYTLIRKPDYLYEQDKVSNELVSKYKDCKCLFFSSNGWAPIASALQLQAFNDFFLLGGTLTKQAIRYIDSNNTDNIVVFVDIDSAVGKQLDPNKILGDIMKTTEYHHFNLLFTNDEFSAAYLLSK